MSAPYELAVLGSPVAHSLSPVMHQAGLDALGLAGRYVAIDVDEDGMRLQADRMRDGRLTGANITMPHKRLAAELVDGLSDVARRAGSVNTWYLDDGTLLGHSTDVHGVRDVIRRRLLPTERILILGSGGAAAAAIVACEQWPVTVSARSMDRAARLIERIGARAEVAPWGEPVPAATIVNATPIGMHGEPLPQPVLAAAVGVFDMTYGSKPSPAMRFAVESELPHGDGIDLLAAQAEESFRIWTGVAPPPHLFERTARNASRTANAPPIQEGSE